MSLFSKFSALVLALGVMLFAGAAMACDNCGGGYYGGRAVYSCNNGLYDCRTETSFYQPRCDDGCYRHYGCGDGCYHRRSGCCEHSYVRGFRDGYETARYEGDDNDRGEYDGDHHWHDYERWQDNNGGWHDGWRGGDGHWHDREARDDHHDGDHHDGDGHDHDGHDGDHHDGDHHDGGHDGHDGHDDHHDGDHHDHP